MKPLIYTDSRFLLVFVSAFIIWGMSEWVGARWGRRITGNKSRDSTISFWWLFSWTIFGLILYFFWPIVLPQTTLTAEQGMVFTLGMVIFLCGVAWRWYAIVTLGRFFTPTLMIQKNHQVIQHGPFRLVRHPSYTGILLMMFGLGFLMTNWVSLLSLLMALLIGLGYRIHVEERMLTTSLGAVYQAYVRKVSKRLIPFVW